MRVWSVALLAGCCACANKAPEPVAPAPDPAPVAAPEQPPAPAKPRAKKRPPLCSRTEQFGPIQLTPALYAKRRGAGVTDLAAHKFTKDRPVEVCHVHGEQEWLLAARCADGSSPLTSAAAVVQARVGSAGNGGRCKSPLDLYKIACPEATYEVYMDMFMCRAGSTF